MQEFFETLMQNFLQTTWMEAIAVIFGLASVWYAKKEHIWVFPTGIISVLLYVVICSQHKLYADMGINGFYFAMSVYGWYNWTHQNGKKQERAIARTNLKEKLGMGISVVLLFIVLRYVLIHYTDSDVPNIDATTTAIFLIGMILMAMKKIENWTWWIVGDLISIPLYYYKGLALTSIQYLVFLIIAILGYLSWKESLDTNK